MTKFAMIAINAVERLLANCGGKGSKKPGPCGQKHVDAAEKKHATVKAKHEKAKAVLATAKKKVADMAKQVKQAGLDAAKIKKLAEQGAQQKTAKTTKKTSVSSVDHAAAVDSVKDVFESGDIAHRDKVLKDLSALKSGDLDNVLKGLKIAQKPPTKAGKLSVIKQVMSHVIEAKQKVSSVGGKAKEPEQTAKIEPAKIEQSHV